MNQNFYRAFEDRHRGSRKLIRMRLEAYKPFIGPLIQLYPAAEAVDLGCGRGEWLELLQDCGFVPHGVDLDAGMLEACIDRGLAVTHGDALSYLESLGDQTLAVVSGFHIIEHISFEEINTIIKQALRVLKPGGLLILETPNPENLTVGTCNFFLDPTHIRPIPPLLLSFLPEYYGYVRVCIVRLQEEKALHDRLGVSLMDVLGGVSPDYAIVAQKEASHEILNQFDSAFSAEWGIDLEQLARRYDQNINNQLTMVDKRIQSIEMQASDLEQMLERLSELQNRLIDVSSQLAQVKLERDQLHKNYSTLVVAVQQAEAKINELSTSNHHWWQQTCVLDAERSMLRQSRSWRYTAPLRVSVKWLRSRLKQISHVVIMLLDKLIARLIKIVLQQPQLKQHINQQLLAYPYLRMQLKKIAQRAGLIHKVFVHAPGAEQQQEVSNALIHVTPHAREIYAALKVAIDYKGENN